MHVRRLIEGMNEYYRVRAPHHEDYMRFTDNESMEALLAPFVETVEREVAGKDVLEVACGTGMWTQILSKRARRVLATDINEECIALARQKSYEGGNVSFTVADAYKLEGLGSGFDVGFAADWWSHIPRSMVVPFYSALGRCLRPGARVVILDMLPSKELDDMFSHFDEEGNLVHRREMPDGKVYEVVKNFPKGDEVVGQLAPYVSDIEYREDEGLRRWVLTYTVR